MSLASTNSALPVETDYLVFAFATLIAFALLHRGCWRGRRRAAIAGVAWALVLAVLGGGAFLVNANAERERQRLQQMATGYASTYAAELARMGHQQITLKTPEDDPRYFQMIAAEKRWLSANPAITDLFTFRVQADGQALRIVDSETDFDRDGNFGGEGEQRAAIGAPGGSDLTALARPALEGKTAFQAEPTLGRNGAFVTAVAPVRDFRGDVDAVLAVQFDAQPWQAASSHGRRIALAGLAALLVILAAGGGILALRIGKQELENQLHAPLGAANRPQWQAPVVAPGSLELESKLREQQNLNETLAAKLREQESRAEELAAKLQAPPPPSPELEARLKDQQDRAQQLEAKLAAQAQTTPALEAQLREQQDRAQQLEAKLAAQAQTTPALEAQLREQQDRAQQLEAKLSAQAQTTPALEAQLREQQDRAQQLEAKLAAQAQTAPALEAQLREQQDRAQQLEAKLSAQAQTAPALEAQLREQQDRAQQLEAKLAAQAQTTPALEAQLREQQDRAQQLEAKLAEQQKLVHELEARCRGQQEANIDRQKLETLVNSIDGIVWEADAVTSRFTFVSQQCERLLGYTVEQWMTADDFWQSKLQPNDAWAAAHRQKLVAAKQPYSCDYRILAADGRTVWIRETAAVLLDAEGQPLLVRGVFHDITAQKSAAAELEQANAALVESSRHAGMAEVATGVLHNVGNVLNSVNVSGNVISERLRKSKVIELGKVAGLLTLQAGDFAGFVARDPRGPHIPELISCVTDALKAEHADLLEEVESITRNIGHIKEIVAMQQGFAKGEGIVEPFAVQALVDDAIKINSVSLARHRISVVQAYEEVPDVLVDKHLVLQILVNLLRNAKQAIDGSAIEPRRIVVKIQSKGADFVKVAVQDSGTGIAPENLTRIFSHGFTTKKSGHGFGLHSSALAATGMGGSLHAHSDGPGTGATFILELPVHVAAPAAVAA